MVNAQTWMDNNYPTREIRENEKFLHVDHRGLEGILDLRDFSKLEKLDCSGNQLTDIIFPIDNNITDAKIFPNPFSNPRAKLVEWWKVWKNIPKRFNSSSDKFRDLFPLAMKLVDTSDLDRWIENYDVDNLEFNDHTIMGKKFHGWMHLDEDYEDYPESVTEEVEGVYAMEKMAQKVLARCYIQMNRLLRGADSRWERKMNKIATNWVNESLQSEFERHVSEGEINMLPQLINEEISRRELILQQEQRTL